MNYDIIEWCIVGNYLPKTKKDNSCLNKGLRVK